jgi:ribonuclease HI
VGKLCPARLQVLWDRYSHTVNTNPDLVEHLHVRSFEEEIHHLLLRYKDGATVHTGKTNRVVNMKNHWATPPAIMACLQQHLHITTERFASPLNFHQDMRTYYSCHERDQVFGATWNAFSVKWTGASQCNPEYEHGDMEKAVRWALNSAIKSTAATLTLCILPAWDGNNNTAYNRVVADHPAQCHVIMRIPRRNFMFCTPDAWNGEDKYAGCPKWDVNFLLIGNEQGYETIREADENALCMCVAQELRTLMSRNDARTDVRMTGFRSLATRPRNTAPLATNTADIILTGKAFKRAGDECQYAAPAPVVTTAHGIVTNIFAAKHPLRADPHAMVYTDGSVIKSTLKEPVIVGSKRMRLETTTATIAGAGIYIPRALVTDTIISKLNERSSSSAVQSCGNDHTDGVAISLDPGGAGATNTITRAEGAAIWYALREDLATTIATDSAAVLYQIRNMLHRPASMQHCKNKALIEQIVDSIRTSPRHIYLQKVKAHTGIPGNELADEAARHATRLAQYSPDDMPQCNTDPQPPSHTQFWPVPTDDDDANDDVARRPKKHIGDLGKDLKKYLHEKHRVGYSNTSSVYYQAWANTVSIAHKGHSNLLMQSNRVDPQDRVTTLHYRYGGLNTAKLRHRMKVAPTANCLLCGQLDGGHHSMSGCPHMSGMYTERHNVGGHILLKALLKGGRGADIVMHDIGHAADASLMRHAPTPTGESFATRIPEWVYTKGRRRKPSAKEKSKWDKYRPDILMISGTDKRPIKRREADVVEIKYCRDTDPTTQQSRAETQHDASIESHHSVSLMQSLRDAGYRPSKVRLHVILLGVGGTIYSSMHTTLKQLGLKRQATATVAGKLHKHATVYARRIMQTKWNQEFILKRDAG